jgi:hypothetical protein
MTYKYIVNIEKNGSIMQVEVTAQNAIEAKATALRMYPGYRLAAGMWQINPSNGQKVLCG